jgi:hypothetical protein
MLTQINRHEAIMKPPPAGAIRLQAPPQQSKLIPRMREAMRARRYSLKTEKAYVHWVRRYIFFHRMRHPKDMGPAEATAFLNHLANERRVSAHALDEQQSGGGAKSSRCACRVVWLPRRRRSCGLNDRFRMTRMIRFGCLPKSSTMVRFFQARPAATGPHAVVRRS